MMSIIQGYSNHLEKIFENSYDHIYLHDEEGNILDVNDVIVRNLGYSKEEIYKMKVTDFLLEEVPSIVSDEIKKVMKTRVVKIPKTYKVRKKNGDIIYIEFKTIPLKKEGKFYAILGIGHDVTTYKEVEQKLIESEELYRLITENANDLIRVLNDQFELEFVNEPAHFNTLGYLKEELIGKPGIFLLHPEEYTTIGRFTRKLIKIGENAHELRIKHKNGHWLWFEIKAKMFKDEKGNKKYLFISRDISEYKQAEQKLKESANKFRRIFESIPDLFFLVSSDGTILDYKDNLDDLDFPPEIFLGKNIKDSLPKTVIDLSLTSIRKTLETHEPQTVDFELQIKGSIRYFEARHLYFSEDQVLVFIRDITKRKQTVQRIKESEERFRVMSEQSFMSIIVIQDGIFKYFNEELPKSMGYSVEEIKSWGPNEFIKGIHPDDREFVMDQAKKKQEGHKDAINNYKYRAIKKDGEVMWIEIFSKTIIYDGKPADLVLAMDITDEKETEQLIIEENKKLLELHELRKDLITRVSHELKTPMTSIYGAYQILIKLYMDEIGEEAQKYIEIGHRGSLRLKQLIDNLLDTSRLDAKKIDINLQNENLTEILVDCAKDMKYLAANRQLKLKLDLPNEAYVEIDRLRFRQVLSNIISNAIKNTPKEGEILIDLVEKPEYIDIRVKDTGVGITEKEKEKLFEKFGKIERYGMDLGVDIEGSGLGLYISKEIVDLHGGQIIVESEGRNKGATFTIRLLKKKNVEDIRFFDYF